MCSRLRLAITPQKCHSGYLFVDMNPCKLDVQGFYLFFSNTVAQCSVLIIFACSFVFSYFISVISGLFLLLAFFSGTLFVNVYWSNKCIRLLPFFELSTESDKHDILQSTSCGVCNHSLCKRQKNIRDNQPWLGLNVPKDVDQAVQDLFNKILNEFVTSWHSKFTKDESFILELKRGLRYAGSIILRRLLKVDFGDVLTDHLLTIALKHINDYVCISNMSVKESIPIDAAAVKYLNKKLHPAIYSRNSELQYLRCLSDLLSKYLIQSSQLNCLSFRVLIRELLAGWVFLPLLDTLSDPFCINSLLIMALNHEPLTEYPNSSGFSVQFLNRFVSPSKDFSGKKSALQTNLSTILKDQKLLYTFMQFLKKEGAVHLLQFCLDVEEFSKKILNPDLNKTEMEALYKEAVDLFSLYFKTDSSESIHFPKYIVQQMEQVLDNGASNISKLRTNPALFKAYEVAYSVLEETYCPLFYLSDDFFPLICGERHKTKCAKEFSSPLRPGSPNKGRNMKKTSEPSGVGKLSSKFQKLLQFQAVEGKTYFADAPLDVAESECSEDMPLEVTQETTFRDMSTWRVTLPSVNTKQDSNSKPYPVFNIRVVDIESKDHTKHNFKAKWDVERKFNDFYLLQAKLAEFHGEFEDGTQLPAKTGMFSPRGSEFLENRRQLFEDYLQKLLQKPHLRGSDLLYFFLHSPAEFSSCLSAQEGIGKIIKRSVEPIKLRKERGQHLENFLNSFMTSVEGIKQSGKLEWQDISVEMKRKKRCHTKSIFSNYFNEFLLNKSEYSVSTQKEEILLLGPWDCIFYSMSKLMGASTRVIQGVMVVKNLLGHSADAVIKLFVRKKLESLLIPSRVSHLIRLLQEALFKSNSQSRKSDVHLKDKVLVDLEKLASSICINWFLPNFRQGIREIVETLQNPSLNKHLCFCLLDEIVRILFPELATSK